MKKQRQQAILDIVQRREVASQGDIVRELMHAGIETNQATVSRDIQELGLVKLGHRYATPASASPPSRDDLAQTFREHVAKVDGNPSLIVLKTPPGRAHMVGVALDGLRDDDVVGTIAGDDTVLVVPRDKRAKKALMARFEALLEDRRRSRT